MQATPSRSPFVLLGFAAVALYAASCSASREHHAPAAQAGRTSVKPAEGADETELDIAKLPAAVQATCTKAFGALDGLEASQESRGGVTLYEINGKGGNGLAMSVKCVADGRLVELERGIPMSSLPADAATNLHTSFPDGTVVSAEEVEMHFYEVRVAHGSKTEEVRVGASGRVYREREEDEHEERDEHGEDGHR